MGGFTIPMLVFRVGVLTLSDILFIAGSAAVLLSAARNRLKPQPAIQLAAVVGTVAIVAAAINAVDAQESLLVGIRVLYVWTLWQFCVRSAVQSITQLERLGTSFVLGAAVSGVVAIGQVTLGISVPGTEIVFGRVPGLATHVNGQGGALAVASGLAIGLALIGRRRALHYGAFALIVIGLVLAGSITGMLAAAVGAFVAMLCSRFPLSRIFSIGISFSIVWILAANLQILVPGAASPLQRLADTTGQGEGQSTLTLRLLTDQFALSQILEHPLFGVGLDGTSGGTYDGVTQTHNMLLLAWYQGGVLMFIAVVISLVYTIRVISNGQVRQLPFSVPIAASCVGAFVFSMTGPVLFDRWFWLPFVLAWAIPAAMAELERLGVAQLTEQSLTAPSVHRRHRESP